MRTISACFGLTPSGSASAARGSLREGLKFLLWKGPLFDHRRAAHGIVHATPLVGTMLAIIGWWMRTLAVTPTVEEE